MKNIDWEALFCVAVVIGILVFFFTIGWLISIIPSSRNDYQVCVQAYRDETESKIHLLCDGIKK